MLKDHMTVIEEIVNSVSKSSAFFSAIVLLIIYIMLNQIEEIDKEGSQIKFKVIVMTADS